MIKGRFITFEGGEGTGKSTQVKLLASYLSQSGADVIQTREPGGSPSAEEIRALLVTGAADRWSPLAETLLFYAARVEHWRQIIEPSIARGAHVLCDRFADSTIAYQAYAGGLDRHMVEKLHRLVMTGVEPDLTIVLDLPVDEGLNRAASRRDSETRFERKGREFHERLRQGFLDIAHRFPNRCFVIDASQSIERIHSAVLAALKLRLRVE
ncbi:MAG: dTMP kinase [Alphaproteobacteria bacterium]|nr:dTMP kinase [Alphaproteobacteria bacterium]